MSENLQSSPIELPDVQELPSVRGTGLSDPLTLLSDVQVQLEFVMGEASLTIAGLSSLKAGDAVKLDEDCGSRVRLRVKGVDIGYGRLVTVDGVLGVQIEKIER